MESVPITPQGLKKLREELKHLKSVERPKNIQDIETARAHGDLSENAEYSAAKERQSHIAGRIAELEDVVSRAQVIKPSELEHEKVYFGATVTLLDCDSEEEFVYQIVGTHESDAKEGRISVESPLAKRMMGKEEGDVVQIKKANEMIEYEIVTIQYI